MITLVAAPIGGGSNGCDKCGVSAVNLGGFDVPFGSDVRGGGCDCG